MDGNTCFHLATRLNDADAAEKITKLLLEFPGHWKILQAKNKNGKTPLDMATEKVRELLENKLQVWKKIQAEGVETDRGAVEKRMLPQQFPAPEERSATCPVCWDRKIDRVMECGHTCCSECFDNMLHPPRSSSGIPARYGIEKQRECHMCRRASSCRVLYLN
eukprot:g17732.t1